MNPKVSILWVNFNSSCFIDLAMESLEAIKNLDYPNYELILVDNGSRDGSFELLTDYIQESGICCKIVRLAQNLGFTGGNNAGYLAIDRGSEYVVLLNNDAVPRPGSLSELVNSMETEQGLGAAQGVILNLDEQSIDTAGDYLSELLEATSLFQGYHPKSLKAPIFSTSPDAAYSVLRVKAIQKISNGTDLLFDNYFFGYLDDHMLGLKLWEGGFGVRVIPSITAKHNRGSSFKRVQPLQEYLRIRNLLILNELSNSRYKDLIRFYGLRQFLAVRFQKIFGSAFSDSKKCLSAISKGFLDGIRVGMARRRMGEKINIYKAPLLKVSPFDALMGTTASMQIISQHLERALVEMTEYSRKVTSNGFYGTWQNNCQKHVK